MSGVVVIGAGQAGLALGYHLSRQGREFTILDAADRPAAAWRSRWDSLRLFTPARFDGLPGRPFPGAPDRYPTRDEVVDYLTDYARGLPVELNRRVTAVHADGDGCRVELGDRTLRAQHVVVATGPFQVPRIPANTLTIDQRHSAGYRNPAGIPPGRVLVVGGGNTGFQIAQELAATHETELAIGSRQASLPQRVVGVDVFRLLDKTGLMRKPATSRIGRRMRERDPVLIGSRPSKLRGVALRPRAIRADGASVTFEDGATADFDAVIWATGFTRDHSWIDAPVHFLGLPWQHSRGSALLGWVGEDAARLAERLERPRVAKVPVA